MGLEQLRDVGSHHRNGVSPTDPSAVQCRSQTQAALPKIPVSDALQTTGSTKLIAEFSLICKSFCSKKDEMNKKFNKLVPDNATDNNQ